MSRPVLRLIESFDNALEFSAGKFEEQGLRQIDNTHEVHYHLQLFLSWPAYSSVCAKIDDRMFPVKVSIDSEMAELDQIYLELNEEAFISLKAGTANLNEVVFEVFGITFGFKPLVEEVANTFKQGAPNVAISIPSAITRYNLRGARRMKVEDSIAITISSNGNIFSGRLLDVSPVAFSIEVKCADNATPQICNVTIGRFSFGAFMVQSSTNKTLIKPIHENSVDFGAYFEAYCSFALPFLRSRYSFVNDPVPNLLQKTGQAKKHATKETGNQWFDEINKAYIAAKDAKDKYCADFVAVDANGEPVGTSSLAQGFMDQEGNDVWVFHGLGSLQDPSLLEQTCSLYKWRVDYLVSKNPATKVIMWFDGRGRWLEKVYIKFQKLTPEFTQIWPIKHNRYVRNSQATDDHLVKLNAWKFKKTIECGSFKRTHASNGVVSIGIGVSYLNYSGILDNIHFREKVINKESVQPIIQEALNELAPERVFIETPLEVEDFNINGYDSFLVDATNRQCLTTGAALLYFSSSLEHSQAVVRRKHGLA